MRELIEWSVAHPLQAAEVAFWLVAIVTGNLLLGMKMGGRR